MNARTGPVGPNGSTPIPGFIGPNGWEPADTAALDDDEI